MIDCDFTDIEGYWTCQTCRWKYLRKSDKPPRHNCRKSPESRVQSPEQKAEAKWLKKHGTGAQLHRLIKRFTGEGITGSCKCDAHIAEMNVRGPQWCRNNVATIIKWLEEEIERRLAVVKTARKAVARAEQSLQAAIESRDKIHCRDGQCEVRRDEADRSIKKLEKGVVKARRYAKKAAAEKPPGWQLKLAGWNLPGQRAAMRRLVIMAAKRAERANNRQDLHA